MKCIPAMEHKHPVILEQPEDNIKRDTETHASRSQPQRRIPNTFLTTRLPNCFIKVVGASIATSRVGYGCSPALVVLSNPTSSVLTVCSCVPFPGAIFLIRAGLVRYSNGT